MPTPPTAPDSPTVVTPGVHGAPRVRRSREELRELVLEAGREVLLTEGLGTGAEHLSFKRVLSHVADSRGIRVTNASVIGRIWDNQEEFQLDVIRSVTTEQGDEEAAATAQALAEVLGRIDVSSAALRRASLGELIRVACNRYMAAASTSTATIQTALVAYVAASRAASADDRLIESYRRTNDRLTGGYSELYALGLAACGWRLRPEFALRDVASLLSALAEGLLLHQLVDPDAFRPIRRVCVLDGSVVEWHQHAVTMDCLVDFYCEPDPDWRE